MPLAAVKPDALDVTNLGQQQAHNTLATTSKPEALGMGYFDLWAGSRMGLGLRLGLATIWAKIETTRLATPSGLEALGMGYFKIWVGGFVGARPTACSTDSGDERWVQWFCDHWAICL